MYQRGTSASSCFMLAGLTLGLIMSTGLAEPARAVVEITDNLLALQERLFDVEEVPLILDPPIAWIETGIATTSETISNTHLTLPSLWWTQDQVPPNLGGQRIVESWIALEGDATNPRRVDMILNAQSWNLLDYFYRYALITRMGTAAQDYAYNIRFFDSRRELLGGYVCDFADGDGNSTVESNRLPSSTPLSPPDPLQASADAIPCLVILDSTRQRNFQQTAPPPSLF